MEDVDPPSPWGLSFGNAGRLWELVWGLEVEPRQGNGVTLSLFVLHKAQLCGALNLLILLSKVVMHRVNKAFSSQHCLVGIVPPWSDSKGKKKEK